MRIILGTAFPPDQPGGVAVLVRTLGRYCRDVGDRVVYVKPADHTFARATVDGIASYRVPIRRLSDFPGNRVRLAKTLATWPLTMTALAALAGAYRPQLVNAHYFTGALVPVLQLRRIIPFKLVISVHGSDIMGDGRDRLPMLESHAACVDRVVFCSEAFRKEALASHSPLWPKSVVILNGIGGTPGEPLGHADRRDVIVSVAHLHDRKAPDVLIRAFARIAGQFPCTSLELVGEGPLRSSLEALIDDLGLAGRVRLLGAQPQAETINLIRSARMMCLASRREPFGLVITEAMQAGTPIVATRTGGIPEIVRDGIEGTLVPPDDPAALAEALAAALGDPSHTAALAAAAYNRFAEQFTVARFGREYRELFRDVVSERPTSAPR